MVTRSVISSSEQFSAVQYVEMITSQPNVAIVVVCSLLSGDTTTYV